MIFSTNPAQIQHYRDVKPPSIPSFRCKSCGKVQFAFLGRKKAAGGGWNCAGCVTDVVGEVRGLTGAQKTTDAITGL